MTSNNGWVVRVGLMHGDHEDKPEVAWLNTLQRCYKDRLVVHSPVDDSPYWPVKDGGQGLSVPGKEGYPYRRTSYGINNFLDIDKAPEVNGRRHTWPKVETVRNPGGIVHFLFMVEQCDASNPYYDDTECFAASDHPHIEEWSTESDSPKKAATQLEIQAHGGPRWSADSLSNYGFLDGHAESLRFRGVYQDGLRNKFDPGLFFSRKTDLAGE